MARNIVIALVILTFKMVQLGNCAKVLMIPFNHKSHINIFGSLGKALSEDGHEVWALAPNNYTEQFEINKIKPLTFSLPKEASLQNRLEICMMAEPTGRGIFESAISWTEPGRYCDEILSNKYIMNTIKDQKFNVAIMDGSPVFSCTYTIPYKFDIPYITFHGMQTTSWAAGVTGMPSIEPSIMLEISNRMNFWERLTNLQVWLMTIEDTFMPSYDKHFIQTYAPEKPVKLFSHIVKDSEMFLLSYEVYCLDYPRVSAPNYQYLGPSTPIEAKPLSNDLLSFVESAENGIVIMSLGSFKAWQYTWLVMQDKMFRAFARLKQKVVIQYDLHDVPNVPDNVLLLKWIPQVDLLSHPKIRLFITHGGNNGQNEAVYYGVPMLVIPVMGDQAYAGVRLVAHGYGKYVKDKESITSDELYEMMEEILTNDSYAINIKRCSQIVQSMPTAQEKFVFWVNHILKFGGKHLRPPSLDMPLYEVLMLDIIAFYVIIAVAAVHIILALSYLLCVFFLKRRKQKEE